MPRNEELESPNLSLEQSLHRFQVFAENVPALFSYVGSDERYRFVNKGYEELFQRPAEEIIGRTVREVLGEAAYALARPHIDRVLSGTEERYETPMPLLDETRWMRVHYVPDRGEGGKIEGFFTLVTDVTDQKEVEQALKRSKDRLEAVVNTAAEAIIIIDGSGSIESFNPAAESIFGFGAEEVLGKNIEILVPGTFRRRVDDNPRSRRECTRPGTPNIAQEAVGRRKDGSTFPIDLALSEVEPGRLFTAIIRDITERKRTQEELARRGEELRSLSARLITAEDAERRRISQELHDDFSQRLGMLSVDIETLKGDPRLVPSMVEVLGEIARRIATLTDDMHRLAYSLHPSILDDLGLVAALRRYVEDLVHRYDVEIVLRERDFEGRIPPEKASCLYRVAQESLTNALKHSRSPRVTVRLLRTPRAARLSVRDYGEGFDVEKVRREARTLGLISMEERVRLVGGTLSIRSAPGKGTVVKATCSFVPAGA